MPPRRSFSRRGRSASGGGSYANGPFHLGARSETLRDMKTSVRLCERSDGPSVLALWGAARSGHATIADRAEDLERLLGDSPAALLVAERRGEIVGALIAAWDGWRGNMYRLAVREDCRRAGLGTALIEAGEAYLRERGARRVTALVAFEDEPAGAFWDSAGYPLDRQIGRRVKNL